jgi:dTDP-4-dehydrorhamnose reductase
MRVLVLGSDGMLGAELVRVLAADGHDVAALTRRSSPVSADVASLPGDRRFGGVDVRNLDGVTDAAAALRPDAVVNAVGLVKQRAAGRRPRPAVEVNALFPHRLAALCQAGGIRLVHVSTDCVFSGTVDGSRRGGYTEADRPDPVDVYGMTKLLGEVDGPGTLTLRTSIVGLEAAGSRNGLVEWFLASSGQVAGYRNAVFSGLPTTELSRLVGRLLVEHDELNGLYHVAADPISKFDLLTMLADRLGRRDVTVVGVDDPILDRSLDAGRLRAATGYEPPDWATLVDELVARIGARKSAPDPASSRPAAPMPRPPTSAAWPPADARRRTSDV